MGPNGEGCPWLGVGFGWDNWAGKDISQIIDTAAIQFYARVDSGSTNYIPFIFLMEDYSETNAAAVFNPLGIEGGKITSEWTKVLVPLNSFSWTKEGADPTNIKQLKIELQGAADVYIDEMTIIPYENPYSRSEGNFTQIYTNYPVTMFRDALPNSWAVETEFCDNFSIDKETFFKGFSSIRIEVNEATTKCDWNEFGFSWTKWLNTDLSEIYKSSALEFYLRPAESGKLPKLEVFFEDYDYHSAGITLEDGLMKLQEDGWYKVRLPLKKFSFKEGKVNPQKIKQLRFKVTGSEVVNMDEIQLIEYRGNPEKPFGG